MTRCVNLCGWFVIVVLSAALLKPQDFLALAAGVSMANDNVLVRAGGSFEF